MILTSKTIHSCVIFGSGHYLKMMNWILRTQWRFHSQKNILSIAPQMIQCPTGFGLHPKLRPKLKKNWDVKAYPFDVQHIDIYIESTEYDTSSMIFICDLKNSKIDPLLDFQEWIVNSTKFSIEDRIYQTTFGNPDLDGESTYPAFKMSLTLVRKDSTLILFKLITGVLVAFIISCSVFFINPMHTDPRFGLC